MKNQSKRQISLVVFLLFLIVFSAHPLLAQEDETPTPIPGLNEEENKEIRSSNCAVPVSALGGQGHHGSGVDLEMTTREPVSFSAPDFSTFPPNMGAVDPGPDPVAILVVDAFNDELDYDLSAAFMANNDEELNIAVSDGKITHGALVMNHTNALLESLGFGKADEEPGQWLLWEKNGQLILVMKVDAIIYGPINNDNVLRATSAEVRNRIAEAVSTIRELGLGIGVPFNRFVVNMSFAILPCQEVLDFYDQGIHSSFDEYFAEVSAPEASFLPVIIRSNDPLIELFSDPNREYIPADVDAFIGVASSGNSALPFPFAPAIAPVIFSASAQPARMDFAPPISYTVTDYANGGEFIEDGGWFQLVNPAGIHSVPSPSSTNVYYLGTSFSAPALSIRIALELTKGAQNPCLYNDGDIPTVAYAGPYERLIQITATMGSTVGPLLDSPVWHNLIFEPVRNALC